jgi:2-dehydro-3-deoxyphosphogluconate aldolase/(4S)-4-hydroxy-2-oxoglutarate aldolase
MGSEVWQDVSNAPVSVNLWPRHPVETICRLIDVMREEGFGLLEIMARPPEDAECLLRELNERPHRQQVRLSIGTLLRSSDARRFAALHPDALVSPGFSRGVLDVAVETDLLYVPGVCTVQDVQDVLEAFEAVGREVRILKLCPVDILTWDYVQMLSAMYPGILFCPTGTITLDNLPMWKALPCIGPAMQAFVTPEMLENGDWGAVRGRLQAIRGVLKAE